MATKFKVDFRATVRALNEIQKKQVPFATAKSLTDLAKAGQAAVRVNTEKKFDLRAKAFIKRNIRITPAKKREVRTGKAFSAVRTDPKIKSFMVGHEKGETRKAMKSRRISVPGTDLVKKAFRKASGGVKRRFLPSTLLKDFKGDRGVRGPKTKSRVKKPFIILGKNGVPLVVRRISKKRKPLEILYSFKKFVKIDKKWGFEKTVKGIVQFKAKRIFEMNLKKALASAK